MNKYEQIAELMMNGEKEKARQLFHEMVVESSRKIYESLIDDSDFSEDMSADQTDDLIDDISDQVSGEEASESLDGAPALGQVITAEDAKRLLDWLDGTVTEQDNTELLSKVASFYGVANEGLRETLEENSDALLDVAYGTVNEDPAMMGSDMKDMGDVGDDMAGGEEGEFANSMDHEGGEEGEELESPEQQDVEDEEHEELEDRVMDLEDALDELKSEFDQLMADEEGEEGHEEMPGEEGEEMGAEEPAGEMGGEEGAEEAPGEEGEEHEPAAESVETEEESVEEDNAPKSVADLMREYVEKVTMPDVHSEGGKGVGEEGKVTTVNKKSVVAGKNDMGGTAKNLVQGGAEDAPDGTSANKGKSNDYMKGETKMPGAGKYENVPGAKAGKAFSNAKKPSNETEGKGVGSGEAVSINKKSLF